ncbi:MAG: endolytic transglycosylase MltG [Anaerotruncus sp.]|nr:MAG: endolytic transglycosylase MltG [Anaerotruncus sp.]
MNKKIGKKIIIICAAIAAVIAACAVFGVKIKNDINGSEKGTPTEYTLVIESKDYQYEVSKMLADNGIVVDDSIWSAWMDKHYPDFTYINGEYYMKSNMSYEEIAQKAAKIPI